MEGFIRRLAVLILLLVLRREMNMRHTSLTEEIEKLEAARGGILISNV